jgi:hypothetical protein
LRAGGRGGASSSRPRRAATQQAFPHPARGHGTCPPRGDRQRRARTGCGDVRGPSREAVRVFPYLRRMSGLDARFRPAHAGRFFSPGVREPAPTRARALLRHRPACCVARMRHDGHAATRGGTGRDVR